ncbi:hypothetical protein MPL1_11448, partial [Methylophaga lonarensis MPL]
QTMPVYDAEELSELISTAVTPPAQASLESEPEVEIDFKVVIEPEDSAERPTSLKLRTLRVHF